MKPTVLCFLVRCVRLAALVFAIGMAGCAVGPGRQQTRDLNARLDLQAYAARAPTPTAPLTLPDTLDLAVRHNIDVWIAAQERRFQHELATQSTLKLLPSLVMGGESSRRSEYDASSSESFATGKESLEASFSSEKERNVWDITASWNLLDFGISFFRARQQANRVAIAQERERRVRQNIMLEVTRTYWQAIAARQIAREAARAAEDVTAALEKLGREVAEQTISEVDGLRRETTLLEQQDELQRYQRAYLKAKAELASLIGLPPGADFELADADLNQPVRPMAFDVEDLEWEVLRNRPELYEKDLEQAISRDEAYVALAQLLPSVSMFWRYDQDNNRYLVFKHWEGAGFRASWDLLTIPAQLQQREAIKLQTKLVGSRRTALAVAILTQLHLSLLDCAEAAEKLEVSKAIADRRQRLHAAVESAATEGTSHDGECLDQRLKFLRAHGRYLAAFGNLMVAEARLLNTLGRDALIEANGPESLEFDLPTPANEAPQTEETDTDGS